MERVEKESMIIKMILSIIFLIVDSILIFFIIGILKVDAATTSEIPFTQLTTPIEAKYGYYNNGTLSTSDMTANYANYNYPGIERFTYYTGTTSSDSKILTLWLQNGMAEDSYYSITLYYRFNSGTQTWYDYYRPCIGTYGQCAMSTEGMANYRSNVLLASNINNPVYITRPVDCGECGGASGSPSASVQWEKIAVYTQQYVIKTNTSGNFITFFFDHSNTSKFFFYGYTVESAGTNPVAVLNAISSQTTQINNYTQQQNQQTQQAVEESTEQQTQDLYGNGLDDEDKAGADNTGVNTYNSTESQLNGLMNTNAIDNVSFEFDAESNNWIWNTMTSLLNTNTFVYTMVISILAIGVIKLALAR